MLTGLQNVLYWRFPLVPGGTPLPKVPRGTPLGGMPLGIGGDALRRMTKGNNYDCLIFSPLKIMDN